MLQQHNSLKTIKKKLIRKALDMIRRIADEDPDESTDKEKKGMVLNYGLDLLESIFSSGAMVTQNVSVL